MKSDYTNVIIIESDIVVKKIFKNEQDYFTEKCFYEEFKEFPYIPRVFPETGDRRQESGNLILLLENINGRNLYDCSINEQLCLAESMGRFHKETYDQETNQCVCHFDTNLSNYLFVECSPLQPSQKGSKSIGKVYLVDFSEIIISNPLLDVYSVLLFFAEILEPEVFFTFFNEFMRIYYCNFGYEIPPSEIVLNNEINRFETRREKHKKSINNYHWFLQNVKNLKRSI